MPRPRSRKGRRLDGVLLLDKPAGMTSNAALQQVKQLFGAEKAGHTGSLDPLATGVLPLCFGEGTKFSQFLLDADKRYDFTACLGMTTTTGDKEGTELVSCPSWHVTAADIEATLTRFRGVIRQIPPMYSALKQNGQPLYKLARQGIEVERESREVTVFSLRMTAFRAGDASEGRLPEADFVAHVSKGTYIRTLAEDIGAALGCGAHVSRLHRSAAGPFTDAESIDMAQLVALRQAGDFSALDQCLLPVDRTISHLPPIRLPTASGFYMKQGQAIVDVAAIERLSVGELVRVELDNGEFLGVAEIREDGMITPRRLLRAVGSK